MNHGSQVCQSLVHNYWFSSTIETSLSHDTGGLNDHGPTLLKNCTYMFWCIIQCKSIFGINAVYKRHIAYTKDILCVYLLWVCQNCFDKELINFVHNLHKEGNTLVILDTSNSHLSIFTKLMRPMKCSGKGANCRIDWPNVMLTKTYSTRKIFLSYQLCNTYVIGTMHKWISEFSNKKMIHRHYDIFY